MPILTTECKKVLLGNAVIVYQAYAGLDFFKQSFDINGKTTTLELFCNKLIKDGKIAKHNFNLEGQEYTVEITAHGKKQYYLNIGCKEVVPSLENIKQLVDYKPVEKIDCLAQQSLKLNINKNGHYCLSIAMPNGELLGGPNKFDLYSTHLVTLFNIIDKIESETDVSNLLVALATGSGKTFLQAIWMYILHLSKVNGVFAVPDSLVSQFHQDLYSLLPSLMVDQIICLREKANEPQAQLAIENLGKVEGSKIFITATESLLDLHYKKLLNCDNDKLFLNFDEQHLITKHEARRTKLVELSKHFLSMYLTATPTRSTYELCGKKPVAIMSSGQKEQAGQGKFPQLYTTHTKSISDLNNFSTYNILKKDFWSVLGKKILLFFVNAIEKESTSAATTTLNELPQKFIYSQQTNNVRWDLELPMARKFLVIADDIDELINIDKFLKTTSANKPVYRNGNIVYRDVVYRFFNLPFNADDDISELNKQQVKNKLFEQLNEITTPELAKKISEINLAKQLKHNIFHSIVELFLSDLTGMNSIALNRMRKENMPKLLLLIQSKVSKKQIEYYRIKYLYHSKANPKGIDETGANELAQMLYQLSQAFSEKQSEIGSGSWLRQFIDNWSLDYNFAEIFFENHNANSTFAKIFNDYAESHLMMSVMANMENAETSIKDSVPFFGFDEERYNLHDDKNIDKVKVRKNGTLEILYTESQESRFTPKYFEANEVIADNYFRLGIVGMYVSNKKTAGFSDRELQTVINLSTSAESDTNNPPTLIQGVGRNRGLDANITPAYIHGVGRKSKAIFELKNLHLDDYYPALFESQLKYNKIFVKNLGLKASQEIIQWLNENTLPNDELDEKQLKHQVLKSIARALRKLNKANGHDLNLSRSQFASVIGLTMKHIDDEISRIQNPYKLSLLVRIMSSIINFGFEIYYSINRIENRVKIIYQQVKNFLGLTNYRLNHYDALYIKIINKTSYKTLISNVSVAKELNNYLKKKINGFQYSISENPSQYLKDETISAINNYSQETIIALLTTMVKPQYKSLVTFQLTRIKDWPTKLVSIKPNLEEIGEDYKSISVEQLSKILQKITGNDKNISRWLFTPDEIFNKNKEKYQSLSFIRENYQYKQRLAKGVSTYLKNGFQCHSTYFIDPITLHNLTNKLNNSNNLNELVLNIINKIDVVDNKIDVKNIVINELIKHFKLTIFKTLDELLNNCRSMAKQYQLLVEKPSLNILNYNAKKKLVDLIYEDLVPAILLYYPLEKRSEIFKKVNKKEIHQFLHENGIKFFNLIEIDIAKAAKFMFGNIINKPYIDNQLDHEQARIKGQSIIDELKLKFTEKSKLSLAFNSITSGNIASLVNNYELIYLKPAVDFIKSEDCKFILSLILPYNDYIILSEKLLSEQSVYMVAKGFLQHVKENCDSSLELSSAIKIINKSLNLKLISIEDSKISIAKKMNDFKKSLKDEPIKFIDESILELQYKNICDNFLPLIASFLTTKERQLKFLEQSQNNPELLNVLYSYYNQLQVLQTASNDFNLQRQVLITICNSLDKTYQYAVNDYFNLPEQSSIHAAQLVQELKQIALAEYLSTDKCSEFLSFLFNEKDLQEVKNIFCNEIDGSSNSSRFAKILLDNELDVSDYASSSEKVLTLLKQSFPSLNNISSISQRLNNFEEFRHEIVSNKENHLQKVAVTKLVKQEILPLLLHDEFYSFLKQSLSFLNKNDFNLILHNLNVENSKLKAEQLARFITLVLDKNATALSDEFLTMDVDESGKLKFDNTMLANTMGLAAQIFEELVNCHCYYNQCNNQGMQKSVEVPDVVIPKPNILNELSQAISQIRIEASNSFASKSSRLIFFTKGISNGLPKASRLAGFSSIETIKRLQRIKSHILRPLWWSINRSRINFWFIKTASNLMEFFRPLYNTILNILKSALNLVCSIFVREEPFIISPMFEPLDAQYSESSFAYAKILNQLQPLAASDVDVHVTACPNDVVEDLEAFVDNNCQEVEPPSVVAFMY